MRIGRLLLLDPDPSDGGDLNWREAVPEQFKEEGSLATFKDGKEGFGDFVKSFVSAQKMIGTDKIQKPSDKWGDDQWNQFYNSIGRPEAPEKYKFKEFQLEEGVSLDGERMKAATAQLHKLGLTNTQAEGVLEYYVGTLNSSHKAAKEGQTTAQAQQLEALKSQHGDKLQQVIDTARATIKKFGGDEIAEFLSETGLGNDPRMVNLFNKIGEGLMEDQARGHGDGLILPDASAARAEIDKLNADPEFLQAFTNRSLMKDVPGGDPVMVVSPEMHEAAVDRMNRLMAIAYPGKEPSGQ